MRGFVFWLLRSVYVRTGGRMNQSFCFSVFPPVLRGFGTKNANGEKVSRIQRTTDYGFHQFVISRQAEKMIDRSSPTFSLYALPSSSPHPKMFLSRSEAC